MHCKPFNQNYTNLAIKPRLFDLVVFVVVVVVVVVVLLLLLW
jgi:hypothetical protein